jgi:formamidopyrimidine-DNA glycosylase
MPELPEVEAVARALRPFVEGRIIQRCRVIHPIAVRPSSGRDEQRAAAAIARGVRNLRVAAVERRGKYLILRLDRGCLVMHFRLDGQLVWFDSRRTSGHVDVALEFGHGTLGFFDRRHFGRVQWEESPEAIPGIAALGVDPLSPQFTASSFHELLAASFRPLKLFLLDQDKVAGIGNIYSSEAMWRARLDPRVLANHLSLSQARGLHKAIVDVLQRALECCLDPAPDFRDADWWFQGLDKILRVYGREREKCRRCGGVIRRLEQGGRSTFWCPGCQKRR